ncbi:hypothetical protein BJ742DRAFT_774856 [Cladochytrium replicatum]|nr:hypothetical protein BJ742DRAFT_774856 [Cladochytrium replicatum]
MPTMCPNIHPPLTVHKHQPAGGDDLVDQFPLNMSFAQVSGDSEGLFRLNGKVVLITGANAGIGFETARALYSLSAHVILTGRNNQTLESIVQAIKDQGSNIGSASGNGGSLAAATRSSRRCDRERRDPPNRGGEELEGYNSAVVVHHFAHALLLDQLLPLVKATAQKVEEGRVVVVSSMAQGKVDDSILETCGLDLTTTPWDWSKLATILLPGRHNYAIGKFPNVWHAGYLQDILAGSAVHVITTHPGLSNTTMFNKQPEGGKWTKGRIMTRLLGTSLGIGAYSTIYAAASLDVVEEEGLCGKYIGPKDFTAFFSVPSQLERCPLGMSAGPQKAT